MKKTFLGTGMLLAAASAASAAPPVNDDYVRSLASPGKTVLVMEYCRSQLAGRARERNLPALH